jgi:hypothetical protein
VLVEVGIGTLDLTWSVREGRLEKQGYKGILSNLTKAKYLSGLVGRDTRYSPGQGTIQQLVAGVETSH